MVTPSVTELIPVLQIAVGPVILISGIGLLLLSMTNRLGRSIDRARALHQGLADQGLAEQAKIQAQLQILARRAHRLRRAISLASLSILLAALLIISLFLAALFRWDVGGAISLLFVGCLVALIVSMLEFIHDVNQSLLALQLELGEAKAASP